jgi:hypothetical protein
MTPYQKIMYGYGQQNPYSYPSYSNQVTGGYDPSSQVTGGYDPSLYSGFGLLSPSFGNYQYNGGDSLYSNGVGGDGISGGTGISSSGSPTGSAFGDIGYAISNQSISPVAAAIAAGIMDALSSTSVNSVNAISGLDLASDIATASGASTAAGVDGVAGAGSTGMGSDVGGEGASAGAATGGGAAADSGAAGGGGGGAVGDSGSSGDGGSSSSGDGGSGSGSGGGDGGDYMGGFIGVPKFLQGMATRQNTFGGNPAGPDDSYRKTQLGEYVIKKSAVQKYGRGLLDMINNESIPKTKLRGLL